MLPASLGQISLGLQGHPAASCPPNKRVPDIQTNQKTIKLLIVIPIFSPRERCQDGRVKWFWGCSTRTPLNVKVVENHVPNIYIPGPSARPGKGIFFEKKVCFLAPVQELLYLPGDLGRRGKWMKTGESAVIFFLGFRVQYVDKPRRNPEKIGENTRFLEFGAAIPQFDKTKNLEITVGDSRRR